MIDVIINGQEFELPEGWHEVKLKTFIKLGELEKQKKEYLSELKFNIEVISLLLNCDPKLIYSLDEEGFLKLAKEISWMKDFKLDDSKFDTDELFEIEGKLYKFPKDLNKITMGEKIDIEVALSQKGSQFNILDILCVLLRPAKKVKDGDKEIWVQEKYDGEGLEERRELFANNLTYIDVYKFINSFIGGGVLSSPPTKDILENQK